MMVPLRSGLIERNRYWIASLPPVLVPLGAWMFARHDAGPQDASFWLGVGVFLIGLAASYIAMGSRYRPVTHRPEVELDERELAVRYRASTIAFKICWIVVLLGCLYLYYAPRLHAPVPSGNDWFWVMLGLSNMFALLPIIILEWSSDPLSPEEEE